MFFCERTHYPLDKQECWFFVQMAWFNYLLPSFPFAFRHMLKIFLAWNSTIFCFTSVWAILQPSHILKFEITVCTLCNELEMREKEKKTGSQMLIKYFNFSVFVNGIRWTLRFVFIALWDLFPLPFPTRDAQNVCACDYLFIRLFFSCQLWKTRANDITTVAYLATKAFKKSWIARKTQIFQAQCAFIRACKSNRFAHLLIKLGNKDHFSTVEIVCILCRYSHLFYDGQ